MYRKKTLKERMKRMRSKVLFPLSNPTWPLPFSWKYDCKWQYMRWSLFTFSSLSSFLAHVNLCLLFFLFFWKTFSHLEANERYDFRIILIFSFLYFYNLILYSCIRILILLQPHLIFMHSQSYIPTTSSNSCILILIFLQIILYSHILTFTL